MLRAGTELVEPRSKLRRILTRNRQAIMATTGPASRSKHPRPAPRRPPPIRPRWIRPRRLHKNHLPQPLIRPRPTQPSYPGKKATQLNSRAKEKTRITHLVRCHRLRVMTGLLAEMRKRKP